MSVSDQLPRALDYPASSAALVCATYIGPGPAEVKQLVSLSIVFSFVWLLVALPEPFLVYQFASWQLVLFLVSLSLPYRGYLGGMIGPVS